MKEQDEVKQNRGDNIVSRPALNSSHLGNDEFKSLGQASSELIAKLGKRAKVGARERTQPPSKITHSVGGDNVIYLYSKQRAHNEQRQDDPCPNANQKPNNFFHIFR